MNNLPIIVDRAQSVLTARGVRAKRQVILEAVTAALGFRNSNEAVAASKAGVLDLQAAVPVIRGMTGGVALAILRDPVADKAFGIEQASLPKRAARGADAIATSPYGNLLALPAAADVPGALARLPITAEVTVEARVEADELHEYDRRVAGRYVYRFGPDEVGPVEDEELDPIEEHALDLFHGKMAIKRLDDFEITVGYGQTDEAATEAPTRRRRSTASISVIVTAEERDAAGPTAAADADVAGTYLYTFDPADAEPTDDPNLDPIREHALKLFHGKVAIQDVDAFEYRVVVPTDDYQREFRDWRTRTGFDANDATNRPSTPDGRTVAWCGYASTPKDGRLIHAIDEAEYTRQVAAWCRENAGYMGEDDRLNDGMDDETVIATFFGDPSASGSCMLEDVAIKSTETADDKPAATARARETGDGDVVIHYAHVSTPEANAHFCSASWEEYREQIATWCVENSHLMGEDADSLDAGWEDERIIRTFFDGPSNTAAANCFLDEDALVLDVRLGYPVMGETRQAEIRDLAQRLERLATIRAGDPTRGIAPLTTSDEPMGTAVDEMDFAAAAASLRSLLGRSRSTRPTESPLLALTDWRIGTDEESELTPAQRKPWLVSATQTGETVRVTATDPNHAPEHRRNATFALRLEVSRGKPVIYLSNGAGNKDVPILIHVNSNEMLIEGHSNEVIKVDRNNRFHRTTMAAPYPALAETAGRIADTTPDRIPDGDRIMATVRFLDNDDGSTPGDQRIEVTDRFLDLDFRDASHLANGTMPASEFDGLAAMHRVDDQRLENMLSDLIIEPREVVAFLTRHGFLADGAAMGQEGYDEPSYRRWQETSATAIAAIRDKLSRRDSVRRVADVAMQIRNLSEDEIQAAIRLGTETWRDASKAD